MKMIRITEILDLENLPKEEQNRIHQSVKRLINRRIFMRLMKELDAEEIKPFGEHVKANGINDVEKYLESKLPDYKNIVAEEGMNVLTRFKQMAQPPMPIRR